MILLLGRKHYPRTKELLCRQNITQRAVKAKREQPDDLIFQAMAASIKHGDLLGSLRDMNCFYEKANFKEEVNFALSLSAVMDHLNLIQIAICREATRFSDLKKSITDFWNFKMAF